MNLIDRIDIPQRKEGHRDSSNLVSIEVQRMAHCPNAHAYNLAVAHVDRSSFRDPFGNRIYQPPPRSVKACPVKGREVSYEKKKYAVRQDFFFVVDGKKSCKFRLSFPRDELTLKDPSLREQKQDQIVEELSGVFSRMRSCPQHLQRTSQFWLVRMATRVFAPDDSKKPLLATPTIFVRNNSQGDCLVVVGSADMITAKSGHTHKARFELEFSVVERPHKVPQLDNFFRVEKFQMEEDVGKFSGSDAEYAYNAAAWIQSKLTGRVIEEDSIQKRANALFDLYSSYNEKTSPVSHDADGGYDAFAATPAGIQVFDRWRDPIEWQYRREWAMQRYGGVFADAKLETVNSNRDPKLFVARYCPAVHSDAANVQLPPVIDICPKPGNLDGLKNVFFNTFATTGRLKLALRAVAVEADTHIPELSTPRAHGRLTIPESQWFLHLLAWSQR